MQVILDICAMIFALFMLSLLLCFYIIVVLICLVVGLAVTPFVLLVLLFDWLSDKVFK